jgi:hypothetical protein
MTSNRLSFLRAIALAVCIAPEMAFGADPVAIVMKVAGATNPPLAPRALLEDGARVTLVSEGRLTFAIFGECGLFHATGGTVNFRRHQATVEGGTLEQGVGPCIRVHAVVKGQEGAVGGGLLVRGGGSELRISAHPRFILAGVGARRVVGAQLMPERGEKPEAVSMGLADGILGLPRDTPPLTELRYKLVFRVAAGTPPPDIPVVILRDETEDSPYVLIVN